MLDLIMFVGVPEYHRLIIYIVDIYLDLVLKCSMYIIEHQSCNETHRINRKFHARYLPFKGFFSFFFLFVEGEKILIDDFL